MTWLNTVEDHAGRGRRCPECGRPVVPGRTGARSDSHLRDDRRPCGLYPFRDPTGGFSDRPIARPPLRDYSYSMRAAIARSEDTLRRIRLREAAVDEATQAELAAGRNMAGQSWENIRDRARATDQILNDLIGDQQWRDRQATYYGIAAIWQVLAELGPAAGAALERVAYPLREIKADDPG